MSNHEMADYIRNCRAQFSDEQIRNALTNEGHSEAEIDAAFGLAAPDAAKELSAGGRPMIKVFVIAGILIAVGTAGSLLLKQEKKPRTKSSTELESYQPKPLQPPDLVSRYLPKQSEGNAAADYLEAGRLFMSLGRPTITPAALNGELAPVLAAIEKGVLKTRYEALGVLVSPASASKHRDSLVKMAAASMFCTALEKRAEDFQQRGELDLAYAEAQKALALGYHHMQSWSLFLQSPQGNTCMMTALIRLRLVLSALGRAGDEERLRLGKLGKQILAYTADQKEAEAILNDAQRVERLDSLQRFVEDKLLRRPYLNHTLTAVTYGWNRNEAEANQPDAARRRFLELTARHTDARIASLGKGYLAQFDEIHGFLTQVPAAERWETTKGLWMKLQYLNLKE